MSQDNCPSCQSELVGESGYRKWCAQCDWNIGQEIEPVRNRFARWYMDLHKQRSATLFKKVVKESTGGISVGHSNRRLLLAICWLINLSVFALAFGGLLIVYVMQNVFGSILGALMLSVAYAQRPRVTPLPALLYSRTELPKLFRLTDDVACAIGCEPVSAIVLTEDYNAYVFTAGKNHQQIMALGVPYFYLLSPQARVGLIAHELGHFASDDPKNGAVVTRALQVLQFWISTFRQDAQEIATGFAGIAANGIMFGLGLLPVSLRNLVLQLVYDDSQKAEYIADLRASKVAGKNGVLAATDALKYNTTFRGYLNKSFHAVDEHGLTVVERFRGFVRALPVTEQDRLTRCNLIPSSQIDTTHPPIRYLMDYVRGLPESQIVVELTAAESMEIDDELRPHLTRVSERLLEQD
jgi:Zn-dependent protease with chaperone function